MLPLLPAGVVFAAILAAWLAHPALGVVVVIGCMLYANHAPEQTPLPHDRLLTALGLYAAIVPGWLLLPAFGVVCAVVALLYTRYLWTTPPPPVHTVHTPDLSQADAARVLRSATGVTARRR
jgi:hypothetical protein